MKISRLIKLMTNVILFFSCFAFAQNSSNTNIEVTGSISDISTKESLIGVPITITQEGNTIKEITSNEEGKFRTLLPEGKYNLSFEEFGYEKKVQTIQVVDSPVDLGIITLKKTFGEKTLQGVTVTGRKTTIVNEIDRKVVTVGDDLSAASQDLSQILNTIPGVYVDQDNQLSLRGNANVKVFIDGKPTTTSFEQIMKQYPPDMIDKIEVLTNPPAKYSPDGKSGIINILLKKGSKKGTNINLNSSMVYGSQFKYTNGLDFNQGFQKLNLFGNAGYNDWSFHNSGDIFRESSNNSQTYEILGNNINRYGKIGLDYFLNDKNTLSLYTYQSGDNSNMNNNSHESGPLGTTDISQIQNADSHYQEYDLYYKSEFAKPGHKLEIQANYNRSDKDTQRGYTQIDSYLNEKEDNYRMGIDYTNPLSATSELAVGAEARLNRFRDDYNTVITPTDFYTFRRDIYSIYVEYKKQWDRLSAKAGVRGEYSDTRTDTDFPNSSGFKTYDYQLYPTLHTSYKLGENKKTEISLNYSRRVDRPWAGLFSPVPQFTVGTIVITGNDNIKPEFTNSFEAGISTNLSKLYLGFNLFYRNIKDQISKRIIEQPLYIEVINENTQGNDQYGGELDVNYNPYKWWSINSGFEYYWGKLSGTIGDQWYERNVNHYFFRINNTFTLPKSFSIQILGQYESSKKDLQMNAKEQWKIDASVKKSFMNNQLSFALRVSDIFNTMHAEYEIINPSYMKGRSDWESRRISLSVKFNFASGKIKKTERKETKDDIKKGEGSM